ncbi:glycosyltransferase family 2 protein [Jannaschia sp. S6380]|uniref:glycosyltransferase family 2 protein n=1 Tax=Jannaschia sp. S6380 TaxID=2926408 RepID=UPI001FF59F9B|nr:glycosyltransferase family A protein [Jannaschia sp. S6380]MCK0168478.1 glycosyltransferase family 2 protein [Jannaschia sp. S6380]
MPLISAIVPTYNRARFLRQTIDGLRRQTRRVDEIILWNDGSTDETLDVVRDLGKGIRVFSAANAGKSAALNAAMAEARGDYIWICDDDDIALPGAAATLAGILDANPGAGVAGASYRRFREGQPEQGPGYWPDMGTGTPIRHVLEDIFLFQNAMMVRRELYDRVGPFREDLPRSIDYEMLVRLGLAAPIVMTEEAVFLQRKHDGDRGPAAARHAADQSEAVWKATDRAIFAGFRDRIPLSFYEAMFQADGPEALRRVALLQRACVHARKTDWPAAIADFNAAAGLLPQAALGATERRICLRAMAGKHGIAEAMEPATRHALRGIARRTPAGAAIATALRHGLRWRLRVAVTRRDLGDTVGIARLAMALRGGGGGTDAAPETKERRDIPAAAFVDLRPVD